MHTRREFLSLAAQLAGAAGAMGGCLESILRAGAIEPAAGSSYRDAEHVVILMQENRSFDHTFGTLRGVRGFDDPRAITLPDGNPVWVQADAKGRHFVPFRLDIKATKATWMGSLPHSWADQVDARNNGHYDQWLPSKRSGSREYADMPLTLGHYTRADIPFYFALADAFTVCDQYFCSSLTGTTPNRCYLWTGTIRERPSAEVPANLRNEEVEYERMADWPTFPERLEDHGVSWKVYQNELTIDSGFTEAEDAWLANFGDNPLEYFNQYQVRLAHNRRAFVERRIKELPAQIDAIQKQSAANGNAATTTRRTRRLAQLRAELTRLEAERDRFQHKSLETLSPRERALHARAFDTNAGDPFYRQLTDLVYHEGGAQRRIRVPKGDVLHQFRADVHSGSLPAVSWIVSPQTFSDHPSSPWYGAWYIAEVLDILTQNPDVWKKTIFLLTYDENDGYFDHVPPFVAPRPHRPETGRTTRGIDTAVEYVELAQDRKRTRSDLAREGPIGLGYRVPMVIASPWSRGGCVCSQVFDHTSVLQFLEKFLTHKLGRKVTEPNISQWRRTVCGDLTASFQTSAKPPGAALPFPPRDQFLESIHQAQFKELPTGFHALSHEELEAIRQDPSGSSMLTRQEPGTRPSCPLPYELVAEGSLKGAEFTIRFEARNQVFGARAAGAPFAVYALGSRAKVTVRNYAVEAGEHLDDSWPLSDFENGRYHLRVYGPNGFFREFAGGKDDPLVTLQFSYGGALGGSAAGTEEMAITAANADRTSVTLEIHDHAYGNPFQSCVVKPRETATLTIPTQKSSGWYDFSCRFQHPAVACIKRYAGRIETGKWSTSDSTIGRPGRNAPVTASTTLGN
jgi:phospholipase C